MLPGLKAEVQDIVHTGQGEVIRLEAASGAKGGAPGSQQAVRTQGTHRTVEARIGLMPARCRGTGGGGGEEEPLPLLFTDKVLFGK